jgi:methanogenic corrinoid protein MtbC1
MVQGDLHDIGNNRVKMMIERAGFETIDLGTGAAPQAFVRAVVSTSHSLSARAPC